MSTPDNDKTLPPVEFEKTNTMPPSPTGSTGLSGSAPGGAGGSFGRYQLKKKLGEGGMGAVYLARHTMLQHRVACTSRMTAPWIVTSP